MSDDPSLLTQNDGTDSSPAPSTPPNPVMQDQPPAQPTKPGGLFKSLLFGALTGLAASAGQGRGESSGGAFAGGLASGVGAQLAKPGQQAQQAAELDQTKAATALHYANLAKLQRDMNLMPDSKFEAHMDDAIDHTDALTKAGAITPMSEASSDVTDAQNALTKLHAANPWAVYSISPVRGSDGKVAYQVSQFTKAPLTEPVTLSGLGPDGKDMIIPAGVSGETVGKAYTAAFTKKMDNDAKAAIAKGNQGTRVDVQKLKNEGAANVANIKAAADTAKAANKPQDMVFGTDPEGRQVAGSQAELQAAGVKNPVKLPGTEAQKVVVARQLITQRAGLFDLISKDIDNLEKQNKLGVLDSRLGTIKAQSIGSDPAFQPLLSHVGLLHTAVMQAHVGARGSESMLGHFKKLANPEISDAPTLKSGLGAIREYIEEKAMIPKAAGASSQPNAAPQSFAAWKNSQAGSQ